MRTKTLLLTAATIVAGFVSAQAQTVYSQNVVGYINITIPANRFFFLGNQLTNAGTGNAINQVLTNGPASDPNAVTNTVAYIWNNSGGFFDTFQFYTAADADNQFGQNFGNGWYDSGGNLITKTLDQGAGTFIGNPSPSAITLTLVGQVPQGTNFIKVTPGFNTYSVVPPIVTNLDSTLLAFPGQSDPNAITNDVVYIFSPTAGLYNSYSYYTAVDADNQFGQNFGSGFYDSGGNIAPTATTVGSGFFIFHPGATNTWKYSFNVQ